MLFLLALIFANPTAEIYIEGIQKPLRCELFKDIVPKTVENFIQLSQGFNYKNSIKSYSGCIFHRLIKGFVAQGGDILNGNGTGSLSIYGGRFEDENFTKKHFKGSLSMANSGPDSNGSQFFICMDRLHFLDNKHVVFGQVVNEDFDILDLINVMPTSDSDKPLKDIVIREIKIRDNKEL